jgi:circadian clock protein KaiC
MDRRPFQLDLLPTGVPNLDPVLGGGVPAVSMTIIAGEAGAGKTTLAMQIAFRNGTVARPAIVFSTLGEPPLKLLRYQQLFSFFDPTKVGSAVHFVDVSHASEGGTLGLLGEMRLHIEQLSPGLIVVDSFKAIEDLAPAGKASARTFVHDLAVLLAAWQCTAFLVGEYPEREVGVGAEFTVADNVLLLTQETRRTAAVRRLQVIKMRGLAPQSGRHAFRITGDGLQVYPRLPEIAAAPRRVKGERASFGIAGLDEMMRGGLPRGQTCLIAGASGTGKTLLALHFLVAGANKGEPVVMATFEESPAEHAEKMAAFGWDLAELERQGLVAMVYLRPIDLSIDEVMSNIDGAITRLNARRVVINSISGLHVALAETGREEVREGLYRMTASFNARGLTTLLTTETPDMFGDVRLSVEGISYLADSIVFLRYVEIASELRKALLVVKMRTSDHDRELREYRFGQRGVVVEKSFRQYDGVLSGIPTLRALLEPQPFTAGLTEQEESLMQTLLALRQASVQELADALGLAVAEAQGTLDKLIDTGYAMKTDRAGRTTYRVSLVTPGARSERR